MSTLAVAPEPPRAEAAPAPTEAHCPSCAQTLAGPYCHRCGEHDPAARDWSVRHFVGEVAEEVLSLDSRALRSVHALLFRPGFLTLEYLRGRRRAYVGPLKLFLVVFAVMILGMPLILKAAGEQRAGAETQQDIVNRQAAIVVDQVAERRGVTSEGARREIAREAMKTATWFSVLVPLTFGAVVHAMFRRRRRWYAENLVFATHFAAFNYLLTVFLVLAQIVLGRLGDVANILLALLATCLGIAYLAKAVERVYETSRWGSVGRALVLLLGFSFAQSVTLFVALGTAALVLMYF